MLIVVEERWPATMRVAGDGVPRRTVARQPDGKLSCELPEGKRAFALLESADGRLRSAILDCGVAGRSDRIELRVAPRLVREAVLDVPREVTNVQAWVALAAARDAGDLCRLSSEHCHERSNRWAATVRLLAESKTWICLTMALGDVWLELPSFGAEISGLPLVLPPLAALRVRDAEGRPVAGALAECVLHSGAKNAESHGTPAGMEMPFVLGLTDAQGRLCLPASLVGARSVVVLAPGYTPWAGTLTTDIVLQPHARRPLPPPPFDNDHNFFFQFSPTQERSRLLAFPSAGVADRSLLPPESGEVTAWSTSSQSAHANDLEWRQLEAMTVQLTEPTGLQDGHFAMGAPGLTGGLTVRSDGRTDFSDATPAYRLASMYVLGNSHLPPGARTVPVCARGPVTYVRHGQALRWHVKGALREPFDAVPAEPATLSLRVADPTGLHLFCELVGDDPAVFAVDNRGFALCRHLFAAFVNAGVVQVPLPAKLRVRVRSSGHYLHVDAPEPLTAGQRHELVARPRGAVLVYSDTDVHLGTGDEGHAVYRLPTLRASLIADVPAGQHELRNANRTTRIRVDSPLHIVSMHE